MLGIFEGNVLPATVGLAFNVAGASIAVRGAMAMSDRGLEAIAGELAASRLAARAMSAQRFDFRWAGVLLLTGFALQLLGAANPGASVDAALWLALAIGLAAYAVTREPTVRHDVAMALGRAAEHEPPAPVERLALRAA